MSLPAPFKLQKLTILAFTTSKRDIPAGKPFEVMFNPESITTHHGNVYEPKKNTSPLPPEQQFRYPESDTLRLKLIFDGTDVSDMGIMSFTALSVTDRVNSFLDLCFSVQGKIHTPNALRIQWGEGILKNFDCFLESVDIEYTLFDRDGSPLRATLNTNFIKGSPSDKVAKETNLQSPDVMHTHVVKAGDTLPLLCKEIYGSTHHYLRVAQVNQLDNFRSLTPGKTLIFPRLES